MNVAAKSEVKTETHEVVQELFTDANVNALNAVLVDRRIAADRIIAIFLISGQRLIKPTPSQYHVLYRSS